MYWLRKILNIPRWFVAFLHFVYFENPFFQTSSVEIVLDIFQPLSPTRKKSAHINQKSK